jgi:2-phosphosulfolactate phosphatase
MKTAQKRHVDICFSPLLFDNYKRKDNIVVVIDLFRATTVMVTAMKNGASSIKPVADIETASKLANHGYLIAGERNGDQLDDFDFGNSPLEFQTDRIDGKRIAITTTNGTQAFAAAQGYETIAAALLNYSAVIDYIKESNKDVLLLCSGWTMKMNIEDTLLAGALANDLLQMDAFYSMSDSITIASSLLNAAGDDWISFILEASPRLKGKYEMLKEDMAWAMQRDIADIVPIMNNNELCISK